MSPPNLHALLIVVLGAVQNAPAPGETTEAVSEPVAMQAEGAPPREAQQVSSPATPEKVQHKKKKTKHKKRRNKKRKQKPHWQFSAPGDARLSLGFMSGLRTRHVHTPLVLASAQVDPGFRHDIWDLRVLAGAEQRETFAAKLDQTSGSLALRVQSRPLGWLKLELMPELYGVRRPKWPDQYQPRSDGTLGSTDRYSYYERRLGAQATVHPTRGHWLDLGYRYRLADYKQDPAFDPIAAPSHLTPGDHERHELQLQWRWVPRPLRVKVGADAFIKNSFFYFSRDAHTGATHAGAGGAPPNPLQQTRGVEPFAEVQWRLLEDHLQLGVGYGYALIEDTFQGYYSQAGHHPAFDIEYRGAAGWQVALGLEAWLWRYGENSYQAGPGHPDLTSGDRRVDRKLQITFDSRVPLGNHWSLQASVSYALRDTNFPPYEPGVFPASRQYDIDWNYRNVLLLAGARYAW